MPNLHPMFVHFPIALLTLSALADIASLILKRKDFERLAWWLQLMGIAGLVGTIASGLFAEQSVMISVLAKDHFEIHEQTAFAASGLYALLFLWRIGAKTNLPFRREWIFACLSLLGTVLVWIVAWYGGQLVYRFGVGVQHP